METSHHRLDPFRESSWNMNAVSFRLVLTVGLAPALPGPEPLGCICAPVTEMIFGNRVRSYKNVAVSA